MRAPRTILPMEGRTTVLSEVAHYRRSLCCAVEVALTGGALWFCGAGVPYRVERDGAQVAVAACRQV